jgi:uncharacterized membrane protein YadS
MPVWAWQGDKAAKQQSNVVTKCLRQLHPMFMFVFIIICPLTSYFLNFP